MAAPPPEGTSPTRAVPSADAIPGARGNAALQRPTAPAPGVLGTKRGGLIAPVSPPVVRPTERTQPPLSPPNPAQRAPGDTTDAAQARSTQTARSSAAAEPVSIAETLRSDEGGATTANAAAANPTSPLATAPTALNTEQGAAAEKRATQTEARTGAADAPLSGALPSQARPSEARQSDVRPVQARTPHERADERHDERPNERLGTRPHTGEQVSEQTDSAALPSATTGSLNPARSRADGDQLEPIIFHIPKTLRLGIGTPVEIRMTRSGLEQLAAGNPSIHTDRDDENFATRAVAI
ncbi:MAG: hypothetical protein AAFO79_10805, partial [Pseudomonadota bacterium]